MLMWPMDKCPACPCVNGPVHINRSVSIRPIITVGNLIPIFSISLCRMLIFLVIFVKIWVLLQDLARLMNTFFVVFLPDSSLLNGVLAVFWRSKN